MRNIADSRLVASLFLPVARSTTYSTLTNLTEDSLLEEIQARYDQDIIYVNLPFPPIARTMTRPLLTSAIPSPLQHHTS